MQKTKPLTKKELKYFKELLEKQKTDLLQVANRTKEEEIAMDPDDLPDDLDVATSEINQSITLRLRDRERFLITKIDKALAQIDDGTFGVCEECGDPIGFKRLEVRPVTTLCIRCKEEQERLEKMKVEETE